MRSAPCDIRAVSTTLAWPDQAQGTEVSDCHSSSKEVESCPIPVSEIIGAGEGS